MPVAWQRRNKYQFKSFYFNPSWRKLMNSSTKGENEIYIRKGTEIDMYFYKTSLASHTRFTFSQHYDKTIWQCNTTSNYSMTSEENVNIEILIKMHKINSAIKAKPLQHDCNLGITNRLYLSYSTMSKLVYKWS